VNSVVNQAHPQKRPRSFSCANGRPARKAGTLLRGKAFRNLDTNYTKGIDLVNEANEELHECDFDTVSRLFPNYEFLAEAIPAFQEVPTSE
jgi:hypothetical protein